MARHVAVSSSLEEEQALSNEKPAGHKQPVLKQVLGALSSDKLFFDSIRYRYDMRVFFSITIRYDTI